MCPPLQGTLSTPPHSTPGFFGMPPTSLGLDPPCHPAPCSRGRCCSWGLILVQSFQTWKQKEPSKGSVGTMGIGP